MKMLEGIFLSNLLVPILIIVCGFILYKYPYKKINDIYGYRTGSSKKNKETWKFAQKYCGALWIKLGVILLVISFLVQYCILKYIPSSAEMVGYIICTLQVIIIIVSIIPVEKALKKNFDKDGNKK